MSQERVENFISAYRETRGTLEKKRPEYLAEEIHAHAAAAALHSTAFKVDGPPFLSETDEQVYRRLEELYDQQVTSKVYKSGTEKGWARVKQNPIARKVLGINE